MRRPWTFRPSLRSRRIRASTVRGEARAERAKRHRLGYTLRVIRPRERKHFEAIATAEAEAAQESIEAAARRTPGENIEIGFALSAFAASFGGEIDHPDEVSPARCWRTRSAEA